ncbi:hypothetical protein TWF481_010394 [Arthrobotrys musiformis]|uniref:Uncharacterized protein n=1 Tax=Arthrobotrys musiformis TaxID=47236 RepID=A0AAV9W6L9_9PEZI
MSSVDPGIGVTLGRVVATPTTPNQLKRAKKRSNSLPRFRKLPMDEICPDVKGATEFRTLKGYIPAEEHPGCCYRLVTGVLGDPAATSSWANEMLKKNDGSLNKLAVFCYNQVIERHEFHINCDKNSIYWDWPSSLVPKGILVFTLVERTPLSPPKQTPTSLQETASDVALAWSMAIDAVQQIWVAPSTPLARPSGFDRAIRTAFPEAVPVEQEQSEPECPPCPPCPPCPCSSPSTEQAATKPTKMATRSSNRKRACQPTMRPTTSEDRCGKVPKRQRAKSKSPKVADGEVLFVLRRTPLESNSNRNKRFLRERSRASETEKA